MEDTDAHDKSVLGIKGDIFAIEEDDKDWVKGGAEERMVPFDVYTQLYRLYPDTLEVNHHLNKHCSF